MYRVRLERHSYGLVVDAKHSPERSVRNKSVGTTSRSRHYDVIARGYQNGGPRARLPHFGQSTHMFFVVATCCVIPLDERCEWQNRVTTRTLRCDLRAYRVILRATRCTGRVELMSRRYSDTAWKKIHGSSCLSEINSKRRSRFSR